MHSSQFAQGAYVGSGTSNLRSKVTQVYAARHSAQQNAVQPTQHMFPHVARCLMLDQICQSCFSDGVS